MKVNLFAKPLILLLIFLTLVPFCPAQNSPNPTPNQQNTDIMGEDDHLPFMQNEQSQTMQEPSSGGLLLKTLGAMLLIVGLIFGGAWGAKKLGFGNFNPKNLADDVDLKILTSVSLGNGRTISTVRFGERVLLVGSTAQSFTLLAEEAKPEEAAPMGSRSVAEMLDDEITPFNTEFEKAQERLNLENGGQIQ